MKFLKLSLITLSILFSHSLLAQEVAAPEETEEKPTFSVSGSVDTYFRSNDYAPYTSFANDPGFAIGMANVIMSYEGDKHGFVADLV